MAKDKNKNRINGMREGGGSGMEFIPQVDLTGQGGEGAVLGLGPIRPKKLSKRDHQGREELSKQMKGEGPAPEYTAPQRQKRTGAPNIPKVEVKIETKKTTKERLEERLDSSSDSLGIDDEVRVRNVLEEVGCNPDEEDLEKVVGLLIQNSKRITGEIANMLIAKYGEKDVGEYLDAGELDVIVNDAMHEIEEKFGEFAKKYYLKVWREKEERGELTEAQQKNGPKLAEDISKIQVERETLAPAAELRIDKLGETEEQKEAEDFVKKVLFQEVRHVRKTIGKILALISDIDAEKKRISLKDTKRELAGQILQARLYNPNILEHIKRFDELSRLEGVDIETISQRIISDPRITVLEDSPESESKSETDYKYLVRENAKHEAREIFRNDPKTGEYAKALLTLNYAIGSRKVRIENVEQKDGEAETRIGPEDEELIEKIKSAVDERLKFVLEKINSLTEEQKKALGIDEAELQSGIENLKSAELQKIYKWCQDRFGGPLKEEVSDPKKFEDWINHYANSAFIVHGNEAMKRAYERVFTGGTIPIQEPVYDRLVQFNEDEERFLSLYLKKYQEEIISFFELVKSDEEIEKFKKSLLYNIKETRKWAVKRGFEKRKADVLGERLERGVMDFFEEREEREEFIPTSWQMKYVRRMMDFLKEFSEGISKIVEEKEQQDSWTEEDLKRQLRTTTGELSQKYIIGQEGFEDIFEGDDFEKLLGVAIKKYSRRKLKK